MFEQDYARTRDFLKSKMPEYLKRRGINAAAKFLCLNPAHQERLPTMTYNPADCTVRCYECGASYDIFQLIGIDNRIPDYPSQFKKAHEMFIGEVPYQLMDYVRRLQDGGHQDSAALASQNFDDGPVFEIESSDYRADSGQIYAQTQVQPVRSQPFSAPNSYSPSDVAPQSTMNLPGGGLSFKAKTPQPARSYPPYQNAANTPRSFQPQGIFGRPREEPAYSFADYIKKCAADAGKTDYFRLRGISDEVVSRFNLGYDDHYIAGTDQLGAQILWRAVIIPTSDSSYTVRNTSPRDADRYRKQGPFEIFNRAALEKGGDVFVTEGEFDALSLETLGFSAISIGGSGNVRNLLEFLRQTGPSSERTFYICLDNDKQGQEAARDLAMGLYRLQMPYKRVDLSFPYKDANEALTKDRAELERRLKSLDKLLSYNLVPLPQRQDGHELIASSEDLSRLRVSNALYTISARPHTARMLVADIISERQSNLVYAGTLSQWDYMSALVRRPADPEGAAQGQDTLWMSARLLEVTSSDPASDIEQGIIACRVQGEDPFVTIADLTSCPQGECLKALARLGRLCKMCGIPIIALCSQDAGECAESQAVQNISVTLSEKGDYSCRTIDPNGRPLSFSMYPSRPMAQP
ncbi:MAG: toprim domain-containing protein [Succinivibrio sp.]